MVVVWSFDIVLEGGYFLEGNLGIFLKGNTCAQPPGLSNRDCICNHLCRRLIVELAVYFPLGYSDGFVSGGPWISIRVVVSVDQSAVRTSDLFVFDRWFVGGCVLSEVLVIDHERGGVSLRGWVLRYPSGS